MYEKKTCTNCFNRVFESDEAPCNSCVQKHPLLFNTNWWEPVPTAPPVPETPDAPISIHPNYYRKGGIECSAAIDAATSNLQGADAFDTGNAIKYLWQWADKNGVEDLRKAITYIQRIVDREEETTS